MPWTMTSLADCAARARLAAEAAGATHDGSFPGFDPDYDAVVPEAFDPATAELDPALGGAALADAFAVAEAHGRRGARDLDGGGAGSGLGNRRRRQARRPAATRS